MQKTIPNPRGTPRLKLSSPALSSAAAVLLAAAFAVTTVCPAPPTPQQPAAASQLRTNTTSPPPSNLKVLPKDLTGEQVHEIMHKWAARWGRNAAPATPPTPTTSAPTGRPRLNFADDSKPEKHTARLMSRWLKKSTRSTWARSTTPATPVTCGTCHRGHLEPGTVRRPARA